MALVSSFTAELALQVDRKILNLEEENYIRLDLNAHETAAKFFSKKAPFRQFVLATFVLYCGLFLITNAKAYSKILLASLTSFQEAQVAEEVLKSTADVIDGKTQKSTQTNASSLLPFTLTPTPYESRLSIPSLHINAPIVETELGLETLQSQDWNELEEHIQSSLLQGIVHYPGTAEPGKMGNTFFTGHSSNVFWERSDYNTVFALLPKIEIGADIYVTHEQKTFHYRVSNKQEVKPSDVSILKQGDEKSLTLMTCTPVGTTLRRLAVTAELVED